MILIRSRLLAQKTFRIELQQCLFIRPFSCCLIRALMLRRVKNLSSASIELSVNWMPLNSYSPWLRNILWPLMTTHLVFRSSHLSFAIAIHQFVRQFKTLSHGTETFAQTSGHLVKWGLTKIICLLMNFR